MNRRPLTILLTAVFAAQALGLLTCLHVGSEHAPRGRRGLHARTADGAPALRAGDAGPARHHDPDHCPVCRTIAAAKTSLPAVPAWSCRPRPAAAVAVPSAPPRRALAPRGSQGPRSPPAPSPGPIA